MRLHPSANYVIIKCQKGGKSMEERVSLLKEKILNSKAEKRPFLVALEG